MASTLVSLELEPLFVKGLRLLHSKAKDSSEQLRLLLEDVLQQKTTGTPQLQQLQPPHQQQQQQQASKESRTNVASASALSKKSENVSKLQLLNIKKSPKHGQDVMVPPVHIVPGKKNVKEEVKKREPEKRTFEKIKQETSESMYEAKKQKLEIYKESESPSPPPLKLEIKQEDEESDLGNTDADDFAMEMGLACVVCRNIDVSSGNQLVECQECHNLYHQECHKPPITDQDVNDPRLAWYCAKCAKNIKKLATKNQKPGKPLTPTAAKEHSSFSKTTKPDSSSIIASSRLFKRTEVKSPISITGTSSNSNKNPSSSNKPTGLAGLAASLSGRSNSGKSSQSSSNSSSSSKSVTSKNGNNNNNGSSAKSPSKQPSYHPKTISGSGNNGNGGAGSSSTSSTSTNGSNNNGKNSNSLMSADKRLQIMKKKAEKKMQEKRWK